MDLISVLIALVIAFVIYVSLAAILKKFWVRLDPDKENVAMQDLNIEYECSICGSKVTMTMAPQGELPEPPRHCREDMVLLTPIDSE